MRRAVPPGFLICVAVNIARAFEALSRDALRGILRCDAKRTLDCAAPRARDPAIYMRSTRRGMRVEGASIALVVA